MERVETGRQALHAGADPAGPLEEARAILGQQAPLNRSYAQGLIDDLTEAVAARR